MLLYDNGAAVVQTNDTTWQAYNTYGGVCLYGGFGSDWFVFRFK